MLQYTKLNTKNPNAVKYAYVPVNNSQSFRKQQQNDWKFRLNSELLLLKKQGWNLGFCTLTYNDEHLPKIPKILFKKPEEYKKIPCFSKTDIQNWIHSVRQYFKYHYGFKNGKNIRYFIASEYGSTTHRPHYHAIIAWPNEVSYELMHEICTEKWNHGFMFPRNPNGEQIYDKTILPFKIVGDASKAITYCAKYACKDLDYINELSKYDLKRKSKIYKSIQSFHIQSKGLGFEIFKNMTDNNKIEAYLNGLDFQGDGITYQVPVYIKNKLIFDYYYVVNNNGKRLVKRKANEFFEKHKNKIYNAKAKFYEKLFSSSLDYNYFKARGIDEKTAQNFANGITDYKNQLNTVFGFDVFGSGVFSQYYMCYFGIKNEKCKVINSYNDAIEQWMRRFKDPETVKDININEQLDSNCWKAIQDFCSLVLGANTFCNLNLEYQMTKKEELNKKINDYFNNVLKGLL